VLPGERFDVNLTLLGWGLASGRLRARATGAAVKLDRSVTLASATTYVLEITHPDGTAEARTVTSAAGTYAAGADIAIASAFAAPAEEFCEYRLGQTGLVTKPFLCTSVRPASTADIRWEIEGVEYNASVYSQEAADVDRTVYSSLRTISTPPGPVLSLRAVERTRGTQRVIDLSCRQAEEDAEITASFRVYRRVTGTITWVLTPGLLTVSRSGAIVELTTTDTSYDFVMIAVSAAGAALSPEDPRHPIARVVLGLSAPPPATPASATLTQTAGNTYTLSWAAVADAVGYQVLAGGDTTLLPNGGAEDCLVVARVAAPSTSLAGLELAPGQSTRFYVRAVGANGRMSGARTIAVTAATPSGESIKTTTTFNLDSTGTDSNTTWNGTASRLEMIDADTAATWTSAVVDTSSSTLGELTLRVGTANDADDPDIEDVDFAVPSIEADQFGVFNSEVIMIAPPYPDDRQTWVFEVRTSNDNVLFTDWEAVAVGTSVRRVFRYHQVRVRMSRAAAPYRPAVRSLIAVVTN
jgi:hypothetical protein